MIGDALEACRGAGVILRRELVGHLRSRRAFWMAVFTVAMASLLPLVHWPPAGQPLSFDLARRAFRTYQLAAFGALFLFTPAVAAPSFAGERERGTYDLLLSVFRPASLVLGKVLACAAYFVLLGLTFPAAALLYLLGGLEPRELLEALLFLLLLTFLFSTIGVGCSIRAESAPKGLAACIGFQCLFLPSYAFAVLSQVSPLRSQLPFLVLATAGALSFVRQKASAELEAPRRSTARTQFPRSSTKAGPPLSYREWLLRRFCPSVEHGIPDGRNPVLVQSLKHEALGRGYTGGILVGLQLVLAVAVLLVALQAGPCQAASLISTLALVSVLLTLPALTAGSVALERDGNRLEVLRSTPLGPGELLLGKLGAELLGAGRFLLYALSFLAVLWPFLFLEGQGAGLPLDFLLAFLACGLLAGSAGVLGAVSTRTTTQALVLAYLLAGGLLLGPALIASGRPAALLLSPLAAFAAPSSLLEGRYRLEPAFYLAVLLTTLEALAFLAGALFLFRRSWLRQR